MLNRRSFALGAAALLAAPAPTVAQPEDRVVSRSDAGRSVTPEAIATTYNNFFEFGSHKQIWRAAQALPSRPWEIKVDGLVEQPFMIAIDDLLKRVVLEDRIYRLRCVEAWAATIPWTGFPMRALLDIAKPLGSAKYVRFETFRDPSIAVGQRQFWYPWPYVEGIAIDEAANDLAFVVTGAYGKPLPPQMGSPIRLALPWKYGFKSIKSIVRVTFAEQRPKSFWETVEPDEYGFWANVNPSIPHPRWSQATERLLDDGRRVPTLIFNGYGEWVAGLYSSRSGERLFM